MRIWAFPSFYPDDAPGKKSSGIFAHRQYKQLSELGADIKVIVPVTWYPMFPFYLLHPEWEKSARSAHPHKRIYDNITVYHPRINNRKPSRFVKKKFAERYIDAIVNFFRDNKIELDRSQDIFYSQWLPDAALVQEAAHILGVKSAILGIGDDIVIYPRNNATYFDLFKKTLVEADLRMTNADYLGKEANEILGMNLHFETIYFEVDFDQFKPLPADTVKLLRKEYNMPDDKVIILMIASSLIRKGWLDLFDALQEVKKVNNNFLLAGVYAGNPEFDFASELAARGLTDNFLDIGEVRPDSLYKIYNAADIFCLPSHWEGLATVIIESMACGMPVITSGICGHPEITNDGVSGILIPPKHPEILAKELLVLINDKARRKTIGANAREFIMNKVQSKDTRMLYKLLQDTLSK